MVLQRLHDVAVDFAGQVADLTVAVVHFNDGIVAVAIDIVGAEQLGIIDVIVVVVVFDLAAVALAGRQVVEIYVFVIFKLDIATLGVDSHLGLGCSHSKF